MQSKSQPKSFPFPIRRFMLLSVLIFAGAVLWLVSSAVQAQTVAGYTSQAGSAITSVVSKGAGQADVTITGVQLKQSLSYCLVGIGRGNWHVKKVDGLEQFDLAKVACAKPDGGKVSVPIRLDASRYQAGALVIGYVPVKVDQNGRIYHENPQVKDGWLPYPAGSQKFEKNDGKLGDIIAVHWSADGHAVLATAQQALAIND